jgi:hypothetical protein
MEGTDMWIRSRKYKEETIFTLMEWPLYPFIDMEKDY